MLRSKRKKEITLDIITYVLLILGALIAVLPFLWMVSTSLKDSGAVFELPPKWIPEIIKWENYVTAFQEGNLIGGLFNTLCVIMPPLVVGMVSDCLCAYAYDDTGSGADGAGFPVVQRFGLGGYMEAFNDSGNVWTGWCNFFPQAVF